MKNKHLHWFSKQWNKNAFVHLNQILDWLGTISVVLKSITYITSWSLVVVMDQDLSRNHDRADTHTHTHTRQWKLMWTINFLPLKMSPTSGWLGLIRPSIAESTNGARDSTSQTRLYFIMFHSSKEESQGFEEHKGDQMITKSFKFLDLAKNIYGPSTFSICFYPKQLLNANNYKLLIIICNISVTKAERRPV